MEENLIPFPILNLVTSIMALVMVLAILSIKRYRSLWRWSIPILFLILHGVAYGIVVSIGLSISNGVMNEGYTLWSSVLHAQDKLTISIYCMAVILQDAKRNCEESFFLRIIYKIFGRIRL